MNYKLRIFSFILAIILCSVCFTISYADDKAQVSQTKLNKLAAFGVMSAEQNMSDYITRAEFTSVLIKAICQSGILTEAHTFTDVPNSHQYVAVIETAAALGLISGDGMGRFFPDEIIMLDDALKMVVTAINYNAAAIESGGYPNGYYDVSARIGLLDGWSADVSSKLTWADTAAMILNMWEVQAIKETYSPKGKCYEINNNATVFEKLWKKRIKANSLFSLE